MGLSPDMIAMLILILITYIIVGTIFYKLEQINKPTKDQMNCEHDWHILTPFNHSNKFTIYCPKCKYEKKVTDEEWIRMKIDKEYEMRTGENV